VTSQIWALSIKIYTIYSFGTKNASRQQRMVLIFVSYDAIPEYVCKQYEEVRKAEDTVRRSVNTTMYPKVSWLAAWSKNDTALYH